MAASNPLVSTSRPYVDSHTRAFFHATVAWYVDGGDGWSFTGHVRCEHDHATMGAADACAVRLRARVVRRPWLDPAIGHAVTAATERFVARIERGGE